MGLDCYPGGRARLGKEKSWQAAMERLYRGRQAAPFRFALAHRSLDKLSTPPEETLGAPQVGRDAIADQFVLARKPATADEEKWLAFNKGHYICELVVERWPELVRFSVEPASLVMSPIWFHGRVLESCPRVVDEELALLVWTDAMRPEHAEEYGMRLEAASRTAREGELLPLRPPKPKPEMMPTLTKATIKTEIFIAPGAPRHKVNIDEVRARLAARPPRPIENGESDHSVREQIEIADAAGRWYSFWGRLGHPILASY
jgi:hypothetical protein